MAVVIVGTVRPRSPFMELLKRWTARVPRTGTVVVGRCTPVSERRWYVRVVVARGRGRRRRSFGLRATGTRRVYAKVFRRHVEETTLTVVSFQFVQASR